MHSTAFRTVGVVKPKLPDCSYRSGSFFALMRRRVDVIRDRQQRGAGKRMTIVCAHVIA
ncbi:hypothetical protein FHR52_001826 [Xanthomonas campestris]